jgi:single-strand DNA-binding protein
MLVFLRGGAFLCERTAKKEGQQMLGLNNIQIIRNLGGAVEMRCLNGNSGHVVNFSVAVNERWKNREGESQGRTTWLRISAFNALGQACADHLIKGSAVYVEGRLQIRTYEDDDGNERTSVEVVASKIRFLGNGSNNGDEKRPTPGYPKMTKGTTSAPPEDFDHAGNSDDCPF